MELSLPIVTPFGPEFHSQPDPVNQERHEALQQLALEVLHSRFPWLVPLLVESDAHVLAGIGKFWITLPEDRSKWIEISDLSAFMHLTPWRDDNETAH